MRKKSHISLARYLVGTMKLNSLEKHKKAFYLGSILPDCKPSFLTKRHEIQGTFEDVRQYVMNLTTSYNVLHHNARAYYRNLGQVIHYIADYFTFPHNEIYTGSIKDHCVYEKKLKFALNEYIKSGEAQKNQKKAQEFKSPEALLDYVQKVHTEYLKIKKEVEADCRYIVEVCHTVVEAIIHLANQKLTDYLLPKIA
ncbi:MAG: zinc dependent phospholipase C family protein [Lachnospiraceae bacterium]|nr:zinc dependent phospholipase C family protein [Lachnospiraceae bacterium]